MNWAHKEVRLGWIGLKQNMSQKWVVITIKQDEFQRNNVLVNEFVSMRVD